MITGNEPAMPSVLGCNYNENGVIPEPHNGLTIRQHFAAMAMHGLCAMPDTDGQEVSVRQIVVTSVKLADLLIAELNKKP